VASGGALIRKKRVAREKILRRRQHTGVHTEVGLCYAIYFKEFHTTEFLKVT
jgi:hypothetical protein